ncbi:MAG: hypothetical protein NWS46_09915 [Cyclobacteriaceae bacterium]|nr:hypothetical protein [Cyclobacteriaceae bacterium]
MQLNEFMQSFADEIKGHFSEYDNEKSVIIVPLKDERHQTVIAEISEDKEKVNISSKVCDENENLNIPELLAENHRHPFCKFALSNGFLKVESTFKTKNIVEELLKSVIVDIAYLADDWELKITGKDIF